MSDSTLVETYKHRGCTIEVHRDESAESPRGDCNLGTMVCWHNRYNLGDEQPKRDDPNDYLRRLVGKSATDEEWEVMMDEDEKLDRGEWESISDSWVETLLKNHFVVLPLYLYDHSGITISTGRFSCPWDSGQVGFIYMELDKAKKEFTCTDEADLRKKAEAYLEQEVKTYDQYLTGAVYGYDALDWEGDSIDSCWGFFGYEETEEDSYMVSEAIASIDRYIDKEYYKKAAQPGEVDAVELEEEEV